jgi:hypothetical protein
MSDWITAGAAIVALAISIVTWLSTRKTARDAVTEAKRAAGAAEDSAVHARRAAEAAEVTAAIDRAARHHGCRPAQPEAIAGFRRQGISPGAAIFGTITVGLDYRVAAVGVFAGSGGVTTLFGPELVRAGMPKEFHIQTLPDANDPMSVTAVEFQFWPPAGLPDADLWTCRCGEDEEASNGHWHFRVPVKPPPPPPATAPVWDSLPS